MPDLTAVAIPLLLTRAAEQDLDLEDNEIRRHRIFPVWVYVETEKNPGDNDILGMLTDPVEAADCEIVWQMPVLHGSNWLTRLFVRTKKPVTAAEADEKQRTIVELTRDKLRYFGLVFILAGRILSWVPAEERVKAPQQVIESVEPHRLPKKEAVEILHQTGETLKDIGEAVEFVAAMNGRGSPRRRRRER